VTVYANGESSLPCRVKWRYEQSYWPADGSLKAQLRNADHTAWAIRDASKTADVIHLNDVVGIPFTTFVDVPAVLTIHHPHEPDLSDQYLRYPGTSYVAIAKWLAEVEPMPDIEVAYHGISVDDYLFSRAKRDYVVFLGRMAPCKAPHLAIEAARRAGVHLKLAGEVQPAFGEYWEEQVRPLIDGRQIEFVGEADFALKNELLANARALLFPIQWEEPFGLVMIEAMACGTPVLAFRGGAVKEILRDGVNGWICEDVDDMARRMLCPAIDARACRSFVDAHFSVRTMADRYLEIYASATRRAMTTLEQEA
jgi:glycosyltransferase involved in cell wall biosynthesis